MNIHPTESLPAYALGALDDEEAAQVAEHLRICPACQAALEEFQASVALLRGAGRQRHPPPHVKRQLFDRIAAEGAVNAPARRAVLVGPRWMVAVTAFSLALALLMGAMLLQTRQALVERERQIAAFLSAPATTGRALASLQPQVAGKMYMQAGHRRVVLVVYGLRPLAPGTTYQFWFATPGDQVPADTFSVGPDGSAEVLIEAPGPIDRYAQVMVTVEPSGGSRQPSDEVVLAADLSS